MSVYLDALLTPAQVNHFLLGVRIAFVSAVFLFLNLILFGLIA